MNRITDSFNRLTRTLRAALVVFLTVCAILLVVDPMLRKPGDYWWSFFGFYSLFGFVACIALSLAARWMRKPLMRDERYYDDKPQSDSEDDRGAESGSKPQAQAEPEPQPK